MRSFQVFFFPAVGSNPLPGPGGAFGFPFTILVATTRRATRQWRSRAVFDTNMLEYDTLRTEGVTTSATRQEFRRTSAREHTFDVASGEEVPGL